MSYEQIKDLRPALFKRYCGIKPETFHKMAAIVVGQKEASKAAQARLTGRNADGHTVSEVVKAKLS